jgi:hypothetical protein
MENCKKRVVDSFSHYESEKLSTFEMKVIIELRYLYNVLTEISSTLIESSSLENEDSMASSIHKIYGAIDDLSSDISDNFEELKEKL